MISTSISCRWSTPQIILLATAADANTGLAAVYCTGMRACSTRLRVYNDVPSSKSIHSGNTPVGIPPNSHRIHESIPLYCLLVGEREIV